MRASVQLHAMHIAVRIGQVPQADEVAVVAVDAAVVEAGPSMLNAARSAVQALLLLAARCSVQCCSLLRQLRCEVRIPLHSLKKPTKMGLELWSGCMLLEAGGDWRACRGVCACKPPIGGRQSCPLLPAVSG